MKWLVYKVQHIQQMKISHQYQQEIFAAKIIYDAAEICNGKDKAHCGGIIINKPDEVLVQKAKELLDACEREEDLAIPVKEFRDELEK